MGNLRFGTLLSLLVATGLAQANQGELLSYWASDCSDIEGSRGFALQSHGENQYSFLLCGGFTCINFPGFREPFDVYNDERVRWKGETIMEVKNDDPEAGWDGHIPFNRCLEY